ncbi:MAG: COX15/CtaA family protein [Flavobacteriaceae bacterium]|nr:COX15/CtaA family protein [Flavobacteriaceae bacterium]
MKKNKPLKFLVTFSIILVYVLITAGSTVRMTGSGMGCPDWPKCFGYIIPPTKASDLEWKKNYKYYKNQIIIIDNSLFTAVNNFVSEDNLNSNNWVKYTKHEYATFNPIHTWIEFLNRLLGAIVGLSTLILFYYSIPYWKTNKKIFFISFLILILMGFQAWLGKIVVDSNLMPFKISLHMFMALLILFNLIFLFFLITENRFKNNFSKLIKTILLITLIATIIQITIGTQIRQFIDIQINVIGKENKNLWLNPAPLNFYLHRSFSIFIVIINSIVYYQFRKNNWDTYLINFIMIILGLEIITGILMYYMNFPFSSQPLHLLLASILFGLQSLMIFKAFNTKTQ